MSSILKNTHILIQENLQALRIKPFYGLMCQEIEAELGEVTHDYEVLNAAAAWIQRNTAPALACEALAALLLKWPMPWLLNDLSREDAEDVCAEALEKFIEIWPKEVERKNSKATLLLRVIADRKSIDLLRSQNAGKNKPKGGFVMLEIGTDQCVPPSNESLYPDELIQALDDCIAELPLPLRVSFASYYLNGISYEELARKEGITSVALRKRLSRAKDLVKPCIESKLEDDG